jgi:ribose transport system ATP-binding protein
VFHHADAAPRTLLSMRGVTKHFGGTRALTDVDFAVESHQIHALLGENGAGKSTLIKLLAGIHELDRGSMSGPLGAAVPGRPLDGIAFVHQDLGLVDTISVAENIAIGAGFALRGRLIDWTATARAAERALEAMGIGIDPMTLVGRLSSAEKSMVAIARALAVDAQVIVFDEPTAALPQADVVRLHEAVRELKRRGLGIVYVTHRLDEVFQLADVCTVLRDGRVHHAGPVSETTGHELIEHIIGRRLESMFPAIAPVAERPVMRVAGLRSKSAGPVDFTLHAGEVLGLVGLRNSGQDIIGRLLAGALPARGGSISLGGEPIELASTRVAIQSGIGFVSSKRVDESLAVSLSLRENLFLDPRLAGLNAIATSKERLKAAATLRAFNVKPPEPERPIATLSGGNQQKVVLARWLGIGRRVLILEEPTIGVDVGARAEIYALLAQAVAAGLGVVIVSSDFDEVCGLCHRALVFDRGRVAAKLVGAEITVERLTQIATGAKS